MIEYLFLGGPADGLRVNLPEGRVQLHEPYYVIHPDERRTEYWPHRIWVGRSEQVTVLCPEREVGSIELLEKLVKTYQGQHARVDDSYELGRKDERESLINWFGLWSRLPMALRMFIKASEEDAFKRRRLRLEKPSYRDDSPPGMCPNARDLQP